MNRCIEYTVIDSKPYFAKLGHLKKINMCCHCHFIKKGQFNQEW